MPISQKNYKILEKYSVISSIKSSTCYINDII